MREYGKPPVDLGLVDLSPTEMMFWMYCPIKTPGMLSVSPPDNLMQFRAIWEAVRSDAKEVWRDSYVYITAKTLYVTPANPGNRPGWHSDGFMTNDINYIWHDGNPTLFWEPLHLLSFTQDDRLSMREMRDAAEPDVARHVTYPNRHLLRLDETVIHRVADVTAPGVRTFVKVSVSREKYDLAGNSINHELNLGWSYTARGTERNQPASTEPSRAALEAALPHIKGEQKPVAWVRSKFGDPEAFGEREIEADEKFVQKLPYNTPLYTHPSAELERLREENEKLRKALTRVCEIENAATLCDMSSSLTAIRDVADAALSEAKR